MICKWTALRKTCTIRWLEWGTHRGLKSALTIRDPQESSAFATALNSAEGLAAKEHHGPAADGNHAAFVGARSRHFPLKFPLRSFTEKVVGHAFMTLFPVITRLSPVALAKDDSYSPLSPDSYGPPGWPFGGRGGSH
jgi:hypothetical protein